eukprot:6201331-Pyramimonas_sp.AAC.2
MAFGWPLDDVSSYVCAAGWPLDGLRSSVWAVGWPSDGSILVLTCFVRSDERVWWQFDAFEKKFTMQWQGVNAKFTTDKESIERLTRAFIDSSFKKLRSAEGAFELLQNFKSIKSEGAINRQMMDKFNDILEQFSREIDTTRDIFEAHKAVPPVTRNQVRW